MQSKYELSKAGKFRRKPSKSAIWSKAGWCPVKRRTTAVGRSGKAKKLTPMDYYMSVLQNGR